MLRLWFSLRDILCFFRGCPRPTALAMTNREKCVSRSSDSNGVFGISAQPISFCNKIVAGMMQSVNYILHYSCLIHESTNLTGWGPKCANLAKIQLQLIGKMMVVCSFPGSSNVAALYVKTYNVFISAGTARFGVLVTF